MRTLLGQYSELPVTLVDGRSREVMAAADTILLASGTATLEATLLKRPMVVAYRLSALTWFLVSRNGQNRVCSAAEYSGGQALVPELLQGAAIPQAMASALGPLLG